MSYATPILILLPQPVIYLCTVGGGAPRPPTYTLGKGKANRMPTCLSIVAVVVGQSESVGATNRVAYATNRVAQPQVPPLGGVKGVAGRSRRHRLIGVSRCSRRSSIVGNSIVIARSIVGNLSHLAAV